MALMQTAVDSQQPVTEWMNQSLVFPDFLWVDSISINGFMNGKKLKKSLNEVSCLEMLFRRSSKAISIHHQNFGRDDTCMAYLTIVEL